MYRFELSDEEIFTNRIKTYPEFNILIYQGHLYLNNSLNFAEKSLTSAREGEKIQGGLQVFEINNNRSGSLKVYPFIEPSSKKEDFRSNVPNPMIKLFTENQGYIGPNNFIAKREFGVYPYEGSITSSYPDQVPITRRLTSAISNFQGEYFDIASGSSGTATVNFPFQYFNNDGSGLSRAVNITASALQNSAKRYMIHSKHFELSASFRNILTSSVNFVFIPKMYYGSSIKKGSVDLNYYLTGSLMASCVDEKENGELITTYGVRSGSTVGIVFYDEGVIMLTASYGLETVTTSNIEFVPGTATPSSWLYYGTTLNDATGSSRTLASASYDLNFKGVNYVNSMTILAKAPKGELNYSNNPTFKDKNNLISKGTPEGGSQSTKLFTESTSKIKNIVTASHTSASFESVTYLSKVKLYDKNHNLIGVASLAKPVKKTQNREYLFKLKLDI